MSSKSIILTPEKWDSNEPLDEDVSSLRANPELSLFSDIQILEAWCSYCNSIQLCSWITPDGRDKWFIAYLVLVEESTMNNEIDLGDVCEKVKKLWPDNA